MVSNTIQAQLAQPTADRWLYTFMAGLFVVDAVVGFTPSVARLASSGAVPNLPLIWPIHGALMSSWLVLFLVQSSLMASGRRRLHMRLGLMSLALAPTMVVAMIEITMRAVASRSALGQNAFVAGEIYAAITSVGMFSTFFVWAVSTRLSAPETHKRMMVLASFVLVSAGTARMQWLPGNDGQIGEALYHLLLLAPPLAFDLLRLGRVHRAYLIGLALYLPLAFLEPAIDPWLAGLAPYLASGGG